MKYNKIQKSLSSLLLFSMFFSLTFRIPLFDFKVFAGNSEYYNLVSVIVDEDSYDEIKTELNRYADDIQGVLENTKVVIIPTPVNTPAFNIASLNESLYYNGYKGVDSTVDFESKLIGTVLVGNFNLPLVFDGGNSSRTILPFTDFEDKVYIYNNKTKRYEKNKNNQNGLKSEIWHGVISPNFGDTKKDIDGLKEYFNKNHDFYNGTGNFKFSEGILNGDKKTGVKSSYDTFVFYYDQFREEKALNYTKYKGYEAYLSNKEDIVYSRYTKELADKISAIVSGTASDKIGSMVGGLSEKINALGDNSPFGKIPEDLLNGGTQTPDTSKSPDIQTRYITDNMTNKFLEIFAKGAIGDLRGYIHNAGRYNKIGGEVNADLIPYLVTVLDIVNDGIIKDANNDLENKIDKLVENGLSRNIAISTWYRDEIKGPNYGIGYLYNSNKCGNEDINYLYGMNSNNITKASECSIYRGNTNNGGKLVEANRGLNINLSKEDHDKINNQYCNANLSDGSSLKGIWGGNSPLNIDKNKASLGIIDIVNSNVKGSIVPLFDIGGSRKSIDSLKNPSPLDCFDNNLLSDLRQTWNSNFSAFSGDTSYTCNTTYKSRSNIGTTDWLCTTDNTYEKNTFNTRYEDFYKANPEKSLSDINNCGTDYITEYNSDKTIIKQYTSVKVYDFLGTGSNYTCEKGKLVQTWKFKKIPSYITHKSPTAPELQGEIAATMTLSLPVDKDRYIDFIGAKGNLIKIDYPALFRVDIGDKTRITLDSVSKALDSVLRKKSLEINGLINNNNPSLLTGKDLELYNILKITGKTYPSSNFNLIQFLKDKPSKTFKVGNEEKTISYYDTLVFAIYWNSLSSVSAKYGAIFDNYLNDSTSTKDKYFLPKSKKQYEISYLGAEGDAKNMYIKMDPEGKSDNPYGSILSKNLNLSSGLLGSNIGGGNLDNESSLFKCAPPDGVPIWEWIPAVMCRLGEMMPPTISLSGGECGQSALDLLSKDELVELNECKGDFDKNGINDCIENKLGNDGILNLVSDGKKYYYNKNAKLKAIFKDKKGKIITNLNNTKVKFEIVKIEGIKNKDFDFSETNKEIVYDINDLYKNNQNIISKYVSFKGFEIPIVRGIANYGIGLKGYDSNIYIKSTLVINDSNGKESIFMESNDLILQIRGDRLFNNSYKLNNSDNGLIINSGLNSLKVNDKTNIFIADKNNGGIDDIKNLINNSSLAKEKMVLILDNISKTGKSIPIDYPLNIKIKNSKNIVITELNLNKNDLSLYKGISGIKKSGSYKIEIKDSSGFLTVKNIELIPEIPHTIETTLGATLMEVGGNVSTNFITIYDKYLNVVTGEFYNYDIKLDGKGIVFLEDNSVINKGTTFEGFKIFRLKSTNISGNNKIKVSISDSNGNEIIKGERDLVILDEINLEAKLLSDNIKVGYNKYKFQISLKDKKGNLLNDFNSRVYFNANPVYLKTPGTYTEIVGGIATVEFETKTVAGKDVGIEFQVEGLNNIIKKKITILPGAAMKIDLILSQNKIEASLDSSSTLNVELKDRYNNIVFNDNKTKTFIEVLDQYSSIIVPNKKFGTVRKGVENYKLGATLNPGTAYFKVSTIPSLSKNSFLIDDGKGKIEIKGVGENAGKIETFYFWNDDKIKGKKYNSLYTNLLGSNYGDIEEENYLAGSLLFNKNNRSLAVTSLLNNPFKYSKVISLGDSGNLNIVSSSQDLTQDISVTTEFIDDKITLNLFNKALKTYIGKILYNFDDDIKLIACDSDISSCIDKNETSISLKVLSPDYKISLENDKLVFKNIKGKTLFTISNNGSIKRFSNISFIYNEKTSNNFLSLNIKSGNNNIGEIGISFKNATTSISRNESSFKAKIDNIKNTLLVLLKTNSYGTYNSGNIYSKETIFYYNDPFANNKSLNTFSKSNSYGIENFVNKAGIGWNEGNKSLLEFASGKSVGESVKDYMSFSVINLGDPVISLKKIKKKFTGTNKNRQFDSTIGKLLSNDDDIKDYRTFDYNNDNKPDILLIKDNKYLKLLENKDVNGKLIDKGNLALIVDLGPSDLVQTGDFTGDGFDDIFFVSNKGEPFLLNNTDKNFNRYSLSKIFNLEGKIVRAKSFDMDNDGIFDIVTLDDAGSINIFYGGSGSIDKPDFKKLTVSNDYGIKLNSDKRNVDSLIYFDDLYQPSNNNAETNNIERKLFIKYPYSSNEQIVNYEDILKGNEKLPNTRKSTYLMKSEYGEYSGLKVEKVFNDRNNGFMSSGDFIDATITLTNVSGKKLKNIVYAEKVPKVFKLNESSIKVIGNNDFNIIDGELGYHYLINGLELDDGDQIIITYEANVRPIQYGFIDVGLFEQGEVGDDSFGDIILKKDNQNCSNPVELYRSLGNDNPRKNTRLYQKGSKVPACNEDKVKLPSELEQNTIDENENGIPDYIDDLSDVNNLSNIQNYAKDKLAEMGSDKDNDGIPDDEDFLEGGILDSLFTGTSEVDSSGVDGSVTIGLGEDLQKVDSKLDNVQEILNGLNCGNASCFASPLNWAPLAPGGDPVFMGQTIGDGLNIDEGLPIISALTGMFYGPIWGPSIWPISPLGYDTMDLGAGGRLGVNSATNFFRLFVTPTLTGGVGTAICFGGPAIVSGNIMPQGLAPLFPGGNCIVVAKKMNSCNGDGSDGDPSSIGNPVYSGNGSFGIINGNCGTSQTSNEKVNEDNSILQKLVTLDGGKAVKDIFGYLPGNFSEEPITSLFNDGESDISITLDLSGDSSGDFGDIIKIQQPRISSFPSWLMDWVTRQIEEITNKLTDFPTVFIILPDFSGVFDKNWGENSGNSDKYNKNAVTLDNKISSGTGNLSKGLTNGVGKINSGIKEAYEFIGGIPLVYIEQETVNITLPWISQAEIDKTIALRENTLDQWQNEIDRAKNEWSMGASCKGTAEEIKKCKKENAAGNHINADVSLGLEGLLSGLRKNLEIIKSYKEIPEKINKLINVKEDYLNQILCNVQSISNILGGRIGKNGDRFKAWVELYILIKAILKSWQGLIDVFIDYNAECQECKNERQDALDFEFNLISFIIPKIPIIQFPKWPDIIIDLHNIRAGLRIALPEFAINTKPIILPTLPQLKLPSVPNANIVVNLNLDFAIPVLPEIEIPELPPLPNLPTIELPDLPPPPKLPKMLASIDVVLDIIKLITKAMCILKSLPIAPEWRAGDQIAFLTERSGYLGTDFFEISMPEFSFPFIDAITVTTYVNLEFETDFIVELARQIAMPINNFSNDFTNIFDIALPDLDLSRILPTDLNVDVDISLGSDDIKKIGSGDFSPINDQIKEQSEGIGNSIKTFGEESKSSYDETKNLLNDGIDNTVDKISNDINNINTDVNDINNIDTNIKNINTDIENVQDVNNFGFNLDNLSKKDLQLILAKKLGTNFKYLSKVISEGKDDTVSNLEFKKLINKALSSESVTNNPKMTEILAIWDTVNKMTYSKENTLIKELKANNTAKFDTLNDIINTEIVKNRELKRQLINVGLDPIITKVGFNDTNKIDLYNSKLSIYNEKFIDSAKKLINYDDSQNKELKVMGDDLISRIKTPLQKYSDGLSEISNKKILASNIKSTNNKLLVGIDSVNSDTVSANSCQGQQNSDYKRTYKGIYVVEGDNSYRLFDYLDELRGDEVMKIIDIDGDSDEDILYFVAGKLYLKENLEKKDIKIYVNEPPLTLGIDDNKFYNGDIFYEAINNASEIGSDNGNINIGFTAPTNKNLNKFRLSFYDRVDKYLNEDNNSYRPKYIKKDIVDAISDINNITKIKEEGIYKKSKNLVYIKNIGNLSGVELKTKKIVDISTQLELGTVVNISKGTKIYAGENNFSITYINDEIDKKIEETVKVSSYTNIEFNSNIKIIGISGNAFIKGFDDIIYKGINIRKLLNKPLFVGTKITYVGNKYNTLDTSYIDLRYYDGSELGVNFNKTSSWELYNLGLYNKNYSIRVARDNDYYYAKLNAFNNNIDSTLTRQILLAPQNEADMNAPELTLPNIRIPVYQKKLIDLTNYIYEDSGISNIKKVIIDFDLKADSDNDGNKKNDDDINLEGEYKDQIKILKNPAYLKLDFNEFDKLFKRKIGITLIDSNNNIGYKEVLLEVYSPVPIIDSYNNGLIKGALKQENLTKEPVNIYRFRGGTIKKLENKSKSQKALTNKGDFSFDINSNGTGLQLFDGNKKEIAFIDEKTGKILIKDIGITSKVLSSSDIKNDSVFPKIILIKNNTDIFYEYLEMQDINKVNYVDNFEEVKDKGIYFKFSDYNNYSYYTIPEGLDYNPGALSIYRNTSATKEALFTIFTDGRINTINDDDFKIKYTFYGDYIVLKLYDKNDFSNREIGRILFKANSDYIMK